MHTSPLPPPPAAIAAGGTPPPDAPPMDSIALGEGIERDGICAPYERTPDDPLHRPLWIYALDPAASRLEGAATLLAVPYEPLEPGPKGALFTVDSYDSTAGVRYRSVDLEEPSLLIRSGCAPSPADPRFQQQMVYAVCSSVYAAFQKALGRPLEWGFSAPPDTDGRRRLRLRPHAGEMANAFYSPRAGELRFGYYRAGEGTIGRNLPHGYIFTSLSHDVVAHELTHALLDGLRAHFLTPSGPDVLAFHEGFADLVALLQKFSYESVVREAIRRSRGELGRSELLTALARQFGHTAGLGRPLRSAVELDERGEVRAPLYDDTLEEHALGSVLVSAVFEAFLTVFRRRTELLMRLASGGTGVLPGGELPADLQAALAAEASRLAARFQSVCIRALDYCPPVDLQLGEYLRAVLTADHDLVPEDRWGYREAWVDAFARRRIYPPQVPSLAEDALLWQPPERAIPPDPELGFARLAFQRTPEPAELRRQAGVLGRMVLTHLDQFGMATNGHPRLRGDVVERPVVHSLRPASRVGPDGQVVFDLVAEVTQTRHVQDEHGGFDFLGGATVIVGPRGEVRYLIAKNVLNEERLERQRRYLRGPGRRFWARAAGGRWHAEPELFRALHEGKLPVSSDQ